MHNFKCCICGNEVLGYGNNPYPITREGECCDICNMTTVLQARIFNLYNMEHNDESSVEKR